MFRKITLGIALCLLLTNSFAQTCKDSISETTPTERFNDQHDGTVLDSKTNLIWKRCSEGQTWDGTTCAGSASTYTWQGALSATEALNTGEGFAGETDWRVPNIKELDSIVELKCYSPAINLSVFPNTPSAVVWSSSPYASSSYYAWYVSFSDGNDVAYFKNDYIQVRLVRSGQ